MTDHITQNTYRVAWDEDDLILEAKLALEGDGRPALWNGWVCPEFTRAEVDRYIAFLATSPNPEMYEKAEWDGNVLVMTDPDYPDEPTRIEPCAHGLYGMGSYNWTWYVVGDGDPLYERWRKGEVL